MNNNLTLEDQFALSLSEDKIPTIEGSVGLQKVARGMGVESPDVNDPVQMIHFALKYQAWVRYSYAEEMMKYRQS